MGTMISLNLVIGCGLAALALLCAVVFFGMRRQSAIAWLAASLVCGATTRFIPSASSIVELNMAAATLLVPAAYLCFGEAVRAVTGQRGQYWPLLGVIAILLVTSLALLALGAPFIYQTTPFQLACALALSQSLVRLWRQNQKKPIDYGLMVSVGGVMAIFLIRIPLYPVLFDTDIVYLVVRDTSFERLTLLVSALLTPPSVFMLLAKIIGGVIAGYRSRSELDGLTSLLNRRTFDEAAAAFATVPGALILCDIDQFKQVNDRYGHQAGDTVIAGLAALLRNTGYGAGRIGGEEFALLLPGRTVEEAADIANSIRQDFRQMVHAGLAEGHSPSASFGIADYSEGEAPASAMRRADVALYRAKRTGRDRVVVFTIGDGEDFSGAQARKHRTANAA